MKKVYETPKAIKYVFDYTENVVASNGKDGKTGHAINACDSHNGSDEYALGCQGNSKNKNKVTCTAS